MPRRTKAEQVFRPLTPNQKAVNRVKAQSDKAKWEGLMADHLAGMIEGAGFKPHQKFHPTRKWEFDFCDKLLLIAIEVEGGTWSKGRHTRGKGYEDDCRKYDEAAILGWLVLRFTANMIEQEEDIPLIDRAVRSRIDALHQQAVHDITRDETTRQ